jgi:glycosyltransferase involved in cell wall biosynthesis
MRCPTLHELPAPPPGKTGWPWTEESQQLPDTTQDGIPWPKVSIVTPSYNQGRFFEESIRSVLLQGYSDLEYIIIDAGSTDESVEIIKKYEPWLAYWVSEPDRGQSHAINKGLQRSTGQLFNWQNADDVLTPNSLAATASAMIKFPNASYAHGYRVVINDKSEVLYDMKPPLAESMTFFPDLVTSISSLKGGLQIGGLIRRDLVVEVGSIDENLHYVMDRDLILRLELKRPPIYIAVPVVLWRAHSEAKTLLWNAERAKERLIIARKLFEYQDLPPSILALKRSVFATAHRFAWECYAKAGIRFRAVWHALMDILYLPDGGWKQRRQLIKALARPKPGMWRLLYIVMKRVGRLVSLSRSIW